MAIQLRQKTNLNISKIESLEKPSRTLAEDLFYRNSPLVGSSTEPVFPCHFSLIIIPNDNRNYNVQFILNLH